jgi:hypothetical protein
LVSSDTENPLGPPPWLNAPPVDAYPYEETFDLRSGPDLDPALLGLLPFIGRWRGRGQGAFPEGDRNFAQEVVISHDGRPFLSYESRIWLLDDESQATGPGEREVGWWRPVTDAQGRATDDMEATLVTPNGVMELYVGKAAGTRLELETDAIVRSPTAPEITGGQRLFGIVDAALLYAQERAVSGGPLGPYLSARLLRVGG